MSNRIIPERGQKFGSWTFQEIVIKNGEKFYLCLCKCETVALVRKFDIINEKTKGCRRCAAQNRPVEMIGKKFGKLVVERRSTKQASRSVYYECLCDCGKTRVCNGSDLRLGKVKRCLQCRKDLIVTHNKTKTPMYEIWLAMKQRCRNKNNKRFASYGGRGIKVCERWNDYGNFYADMGERPEGLQIDRINNDGDYEPSNCRWATVKENSNNRRDNVK